MVRPRAENYEEKRQSLLDGAAGMFALRGFDGTSITELALNLGVSKALLYHYHDSKEALLYDMLESHCQLLVTTAKDAVSQEESPELQLRALIRELMRLYISSRDKHIVLLNDLHCLPPDQQKHIKNLERRVVQIIKELVGALRPDVSPSIQSALALYLMGAINWTYTWFKPEGALSEQLFADLATSTFLNGALADAK